GASATRAGALVAAWVVRIAFGETAQIALVSRRLSDRRRGSCQHWTFANRADVPRGGCSVPPFGTDFYVIRTCGGDGQCVPDPGPLGSPPPRASRRPSR